MKVKLNIFNNKTTFEILNCTIQDESQFINCVADVCTFRYKRYFKTKAMKKGEFHLKFIALYGKNWFPTGLLFEVLEKVGFEEEDYLLNDCRTFEENYKPYSYKFDFELDDSQKQSIKEGLEYRRGYFDAATGAGKTALIISLACELGGRSLILVPSIDLVSQISSDFEKYTLLVPAQIQGIKSIIKLSYEEFHSDELIMVASIPTIWSNFEELKEIGFFDHFQNIFGDELHHVGIKKGRKREPDQLNSYYKIMLESTARNRFGFSGSVEGVKLIKAITGGLLKQTTEDHLIKEGRLSKPYIYLLKIHPPFEKEYKDAYRKYILENTDRNEKALQIVKGLESLNLSVLVLMDSKQIQLKELFEKSGYDFTIGDVKTEDRKILYQKLDNKEILVLLSTVSKEGVNIKSVDCIVRVGGIKSVRRIKQEKGRGSRKSENKDSYFLIDFFDDDGIHKVFDHELNEFRTKTGYLRKHSNARLHFYNSIKMAEIQTFDSVESLLNKVREVSNGK